MIADWDAAYDNMAHVVDGAAYPARWAAAAAAFRAGLPADRRRTGLPYGRHPRERVDVFLPEGKALGVVIFVHGGYWRRFEPDLFAHLAAGPLGRGWAVAMPGYPLAPGARIGAMSRSVTEAVIQTAAALPGPIVVAGHSAGGHLAARLVCADAALPERVAARILRVVSISGVHDLRPFLRLALNAVLRLDAAEAEAESPALLVPREGVRVQAWVGGAELPEFGRQAALLANVWAGLRAETSLVIAPGRHHFDVIAPMADAESELVAALID